MPGDAAQLEAGASSDYVVIGAGSSGAVIAERLSADGKNTVTLLEAGKDDRMFSSLSRLPTNIFVHVPAGFTRSISNPNVIWPYVSEPDPESGGRVHSVPRGRLLGGSSSINGLIYTRGLPTDYDGWRQLGCRGWAWEDVYPYFERSTEGDPLNGISLSTTRPGLKHPLTQRVIEAFGASGVPRSPDLNREQFEGVDVVEVSQAKGWRQSTATAYLNPARRRSNLKIETGALATQILFEGKRARGVAFRKGNEEQKVLAKREVILAGGTMNSPQLLQLSGIGPAALLQRNGIEVLVDSPSVGKNLQDHYSLILTHRLVPGAKSYNEQTHGLRLLGQIGEFLTTGKGLLSLGVAHLTAYARSRPELDLPDLQMFGIYVTMDFAKLAQKRMVMDKAPGLTLSGYKMRPDSRGSILIRSPNPQDHPEIRMNYLSAESDRITAVDILKKARQIAGQSSLASIIESEMFPGPGVVSDEELLAFAREAGATSYHHCGTCVMGEDPTSVVDSELRVRGVEALRVADASIFPTIPSANTNAASVMVGEKASDLILAAAKAQ